MQDATDGGDKADVDVAPDHRENRYPIAHNSLTLRGTQKAYCRIAYYYLVLLASRTAKQTYTAM